MNKGASGLNDDKFDLLALFVAYSEQVTRLLEPARGNATVDALIHMAERLCMISGGYALSAMVNGHLVGVDFHRVLPKSHHSLANALQTNWAREKEELSSVNFNPIQKLALAESAHSCVVSPLLDEEEAFREKKGVCEDYVKAFSQAMGKYINSFVEAAVDPLRQFVDKYAQVPSCVQEWTLQEIEWIFAEGDAQKETKADMNGIGERIKAAREFQAQKMEPLQKFKSQSETIKTSLRSCEALTVRIDELAKEAGSMATCIAFTDIARNPGLLVDDPQRVEKVDKFSVKHFGQGKDSLPDKLKDALKAAAQKAKEQVKEESKKEEREPKETKSKDKEKKTSKDKKRSKDGGPGDGGDGKKKSKKSKKSH